MLLVVSDGAAEPARLVSLGRAAESGGAWGLLLREPAMPARQLLATAAHLVRTHAALRILISDRLDVALAAGAYGAQLGERGLPLAGARHWVGERLRLGRSVHDAAGARRAARSGADWLVFGHVFETPSKPDEPPAELSGLVTAVENAAGTPVLAIGGINAGRVPDVLRTGASGVAVIGAVSRADDPSRAVADLVQALAGQRGGGYPCVGS